MERSSEIVRLSGYRVLCSDECQKAFNDKEEEESEILIKVRELQEELKGKNKHIERLSRNSKVFEDDVLEAEKKFATQLDKLSKINNVLRKELGDLKINEEKLMSDINIRNDQRIEFERKIEELTDLNKSLITSVRALEAECENYAAELREVRQELGSIKEREANGKKDELLGRTVYGERKRLLIVGDLNARGCATIFKQCIGHQFDSNCQIRDRTLFADIVTECLLLGKTFNKDDYIILFIPCFNAIKRVSITEADLDRLKDLSSQTNLTIVGSAFHIQRPVLNHFLHHQNNFMSSYYHHGKSQFIPLLHCEWNGALDYYSKKEIVTYIVNNNYLQKHETVWSADSSNADGSKTNSHTLDPVLASDSNKEGTFLSTRRRVSGYP